MSQKKGLEIWVLNFFWQIFLIFVYCFQTRIKLWAWKSIFSENESFSRAAASLKSRRLRFRVSDTKASMSWNNLTICNPALSGFQILYPHVPSDSVDIKVWNLIYLYFFIRIKSNSFCAISSCISFSTVFRHWRVCNNVEKHLSKCEEIMFCC